MSSYNYHILDQEHPLDIHPEIAPSIEAAVSAYFQKKRGFLKPDNIRITPGSDRGFNVEVDCTGSGQLNGIATGYPAKVILWVTQSPLPSIA